MLSWDFIFILVAIAAISYAWFESLRIREKVIRHCHHLCKETNLQLLDQTVSVASISLKRAANGNFYLRRLYHFEVSENGVDRYSGYVTSLGSNIIESRLEGPDGQNTFHQSNPTSLH